MQRTIRAEVGKKVYLVGTLGSMKVGRDSKPGGASTPPLRPETDDLKILATTFLEQRKKRLTEKSYRYLESIVRLHLLPFFGEERTAGSLTREDVRNYISWRTPRAAPASLRKELNLLKGIVSLAAPAGVLVVDPAKVVKVPRQRERGVRYLTAAELKKVRSACPTWLQPIVTLAVATGMSRTELLELRWCDIVNGVVSVPGSRSQHQRAVPLNSEAARVLASMRPENASPTARVFTDRSVSPINVSQAFRRACQAAGIPGVSFKDLRHTAASWMVLQGISFETVSQFLGHKSNFMVTETYQHLAKQTPLAEAVKVLDHSLAKRVNRKRR